MDDRLSRNPEAIREMFGRAATRYDLLNRVLSMRLDQGWRRRLIASLDQAPAGPLLDLATGTGDVVLSVDGRAAVGADFCIDMLAIARRKARQRSRAARFVAADAMGLPFRDGCFAAVTVAFGVRNFVDLGAGWREIRRVLKAGGMLGVLELHRPRHTIMARLAAAWNRTVVTPLGRLVSEDGGAYAYLPASIDSFADRTELGAGLERAGFRLVSSRDLAGGIAALTVVCKEGT
jgi:ubiquinone/menaquinone biosynthesis methyltransferase